MEGRKLDPRVQFHAWFVQRFRKPLAVSPEELRKPRLLSLFLLDGRAAPVPIEERSIPGAAGPLRIRIYRPAAEGGARPVLVYFHFGGCVLGDLETCHTACSRLAREADVIVVSAQYRLAPEHKFPAAVEDAVTAYRWARQNAGGTRRRCAAYRRRRRLCRRLPCSCGLPRSAATAASRRQHFSSSSIPSPRWTAPACRKGRMTQDYPLSRADMVWFSEQYLGRPLMR